MMFLRGGSVQAVPLGSVGAILRLRNRSSRAEQPGCSSDFAPGAVPKCPRTPGNAGDGEEHGVSGTSSTRQTQLSPRAKSGGKGTLAGRGEEHGGGDLACS